MVRLIETSSVNGQKFPLWRDWDSKVRKNYDMYQKLIDAKTYQLQRVQRYLLSVKYPLKYNSDLITLNLLKKKQRIGEVTKQELDLYQSIDPCVRSNFKSVFGGRYDFSKAGFAAGVGLFAYATIFNFTVATRFMYFVVPLTVGYYWSRRSPKQEIKTSEFLDWVFEYRKAKVFVEKNRDLFSSSETKKVVGKGNLLALGEQFVKLAA